MLSNFTKETISAGGAGALTLSGAVSGYQTFNAAIGVNKRFPYVIRDGTAWETGKGYISTSTNFVRETFHDSSTGSALTVTTAAEVYVGVSAFETPEVSRAGVSAVYANSFMNEINTSNGDIDANEIWYFPFHLEFAGNFDSFAFDVATVGGNCKVGLYDIEDGLPKNLIAVHDTNIVISAATGEYLETFDGGSMFLPAGWYFIAVTVDGTPYFAASGSDSYGCSILGCNGIGSYAYSAVWKTRTYAAMPDPADITTLTYRAGTAHIFGLQQG